MTTPEQIEAQASADHERRIEEAERGVIELGREIATIAQQIINKETTDMLLFIKCGEMLTAVKKLNALTTSVESLPEKVDEWAECRVWKTRVDVLYLWDGNRMHVRAAIGTKWRVVHGMTQRSRCMQEFTELHGPARLEVLKSLPDDLVKAAKGVGR